MKDIKKYQGVIPAFYACYDAEGNISTEGVKALTRHLIAKGVKGVYVGGSSGECIYQHVDERKTVLEAVMSEAKGKITVIAHVGCNNTADSVELARHAESVGVDAIASIPPIYFHLPEYAIAKYWNDMSAAAPNTEFVIYNIPQLAGTALTMSLLNEMLKNPNVVAVKNSSMPTQDIQMFKDAGIAARGRDNARTPMQWDGSAYAGFTAPDAAVEPWISVNRNHTQINAAGEFDDPDSVYTFYKRLIAIRHENALVAAGDWQLIDADDQYVYAFTRTLGGEKLLVAVNLSGRTVDLPRDAAELVQHGVTEPDIVISTYDASHAVVSLANRELGPWEGAAVRV